MEISLNVGRYAQAHNFTLNPSKEKNCAGIYKKTLDHFGDLHYNDQCQILKLAFQAIEETHDDQHYLQITEGNEYMAKSGLQHAIYNKIREHYSLNNTPDIVKSFIEDGEVLENLKGICRDTKWKLFRSSSGYNANSESIKYLFNKLLHFQKNNNLSLYSSNRTKIAQVRDIAFIKSSKETVIPKFAKNLCLTPNQISAFKLDQKQSLPLLTSDQKIFEPIKLTKDQIEEIENKKLPIYAPDKNYKFKPEQFKKAAQDIVNKASIKYSNEYKISSELLENNRIPNVFNGTEMGDFVNNIEGIQKNMQDNEIKFVFVAISGSVKPVVITDDEGKLNHTDMILVTKNAIFSPIAFNYSKFITPFVPYFDQVLSTEGESDLLQTSDSLCHALCLHTMKAILDDDTTMKNIASLKLTHQEYYGFCEDETSKNFQAKYRYNPNILENLFTEQTVSKIVKVKQSKTKGNKEFSKVALNHKNGKYFPDKKINQKLAHFASKRLAR